MATIACFEAEAPCNPPRFLPSYQAAFLRLSSLRGPAAPRPDLLPKLLRLLIKSLLFAETGEAVGDVGAVSKHAFSWIQFSGHAPSLRVARSGLEALGVSLLIGRSGCQRSR